MAVSKKNDFNGAFTSAVVYPVVVWAAFLLLSFLFGFTSYPDLAQQTLLSNSAPFILTFAFGFWVGAESFKNFSFGMTLINATVVSVIAGILTILLTFLLVNNSSIFLAYATSVYSKTTIINSPLINLAISTALGNIFVALASSAAAYKLLSIVVGTGVRKR